MGDAIVSRRLPREPFTLPYDVRPSRFGIERVGAEATEVPARLCNVDSADVSAEAPMPSWGWGEVKGPYIK